MQEEDKARTEAASDRASRLSVFDRNGRLGELTGITLSERDSRFKQIYQQVSEALANAKSEAIRSARAVDIDASALSGVNGGDTWRISALGEVTRSLSLLPELERLITRGPSLALKGPDARPVERDQDSCDVQYEREAGCSCEVRKSLSQAAYNGLWSPSGTNWQPMRVVELTLSEMSILRRDLGVEIPDQARGGLAVLARTGYESMLGDVAALARFKLESQAEYIDAGIYSLSLELSVFATGAPAGSVFLELDQRNRATKTIASWLRERMEAYVEPELKARTAALLRMISAGDYCVDGLFWCEAPPVGRRRTESSVLGGSCFDRAVATRCSQRVASPAKDLDPAVVRRFWHAGLRWIPEPLHQDLDLAVFSWNDDAPQEIGQAMFDGLYGKGADLEQGIFGKDGIINGLTLEALLEYIGSRGIEFPVGLQRLVAAQGEDAADLAAKTPLPASFIPRRLREFFLSKPHFSKEGDRILGRGDKELTVEAFLRMVRLLAQSFGRFFLAFQNTHPVTAVILARRVEDPEHNARIYRAMGRMVCALTFSAHSRGLVSIIKGGPTEINRPGIGAVVARNTSNPVLAAELRSQRRVASLTFQLGYPLGPDEQVRTKYSSHDGLKERTYDKRSPRASLKEHYFPVG